MDKLQQIYESSIKDKNSMEYIQWHIATIQILDKSVGMETTFCFPVLAD